MSGRRETIHLSLGPTANAVTAHLLNLEGLSVVTPSPSAAAAGSLSVCDPLVTHRVEQCHQVWVPRVLMVDETHRLQQQQQHITSRGAMPESSSLPETGTWKGSIQEINMQIFSLEQFCSTTDSVVTNFSFNSNNTPMESQQQQIHDPWVTSWQEKANQLAYAPYSPYKISEYDRHHTNYSIPESDGKAEESRTVNWDDFGAEPDQDQEELAEIQARRKREQILQWNLERQSLEEDLNNLWEGKPANEPTAEPSVEPASTSPTEKVLETLSWMDFWMPPLPSPLTQSTYGLPATSAAASLEAPPLHAYNIATNRQNSKMILEDIWEKLRLQLERTDSCQGFTILTQGCGVYAGIADWLLQEMQQEVRAANRWVFQVSTDNYADDDDNHQLDQENAAPLFSTELSRRQARMRDQVQQGLALAELSEHANALVPLQLPSLKKKSLFRASAELAMALETAILPYRCRASDTSTILGWNSMSSYEEGAAPNGMSLGDYLTVLQPSHKYSILELDVVTSQNHCCKLGQFLVQGTSVERDPRMRQPSRSAIGAEDPGSWLRDEGFANQPGILKCLSPGRAANQDRSIHHHFGLSTCLRRGRVSDSPLMNTNQQYLTCLLEGMGIRYRPETSFGLVTHQSLTQLTTKSGGAGSYWQRLIGSIADEPVDIPILSVLGNTTRAYPYLHSVATEMKDAFCSSKTKGYYQREVSAGTLPETDDCDEALEYCWDLRDVYEPPAGSGLAGDDDAEQEFGL